jgi:hypothetical protein
MSKRLFLPFALVLFVAAVLGLSAPPPAHSLPPGGTFTVHLPLVLKEYGPGILYSDNFSNPDTGWIVLDNGETRWRYDGGEYEIVANQRYWFGLSRAPIVPPADYIAQVEAYRCAGCATVYGLAFGYQNRTHFYVFGVNPANGTYALWKVTTDDQGRVVQDYLTGWTAASAVLQGDSRNLLSVRRVGSQIQLYANRTLLVTVDDASYVGVLDVGLYVESGATAPVSARFDNFQLFVAGTSGLNAVSQSRTSTELGIDGPLPALRER